MRDLAPDFPITEEVNYLNTASIGLVPLPVKEYYLEFESRLAGGGTLTLDEETEDLVYESLRGAASRLLGCSPDSVAVFNSVSEALNAVAWGLGVEEGRLVSTALEFPSVTYPLLRMAEVRRGVEAHLVQPEGWHLPTESILQAINEDTRAVFITHVENLTGQLNDLKAITRRAHRVGAKVVVDGVQAAGCIPVDVGELGVDAYVSGSYKYLCGPFGAAFAYLSPRLLEELEPLYVGWRTSENMWGLEPTHIQYPGNASRFEYSTSAYGVKLALAKSIEYLLELGVGRIHRHTQGLVRALEEELQSLGGLEQVTPPSRGSIYSFQPKALSPAELAKALKALNRPVELSLRRGLVRLSPHIYNTEEDVAQAAQAVGRLLP